MAMRKYTFKLYPKPAQQEALLGQLRLHQQLYNAALQERIDCYQKTGNSISYNDQQKSLTQIRSELSEYKALPCTSERMTLRRLDKAFKAFFRRVKAGEEPGFPRFKSLSRFSSFEIMTPKFIMGDSGKHGRLFIAGIGHIKARGKARISGAIKTSQIKHKHGQWWISVTVDGEVKRDARGTKACAMDWGIAHLLTVVEESGDYQHVPNPRYYQTSKEVETELGQVVARKKRGSTGWKRACKKLSTFKRKQAARRQDAQHKLSADIASQYSLVAMEKLQIKNMTKSAKGTQDDPGSMVAQKAGLNREILDTAPAALYSKIRYKVEETGGEFIETPTKKLKPSQRCPSCTHTHKDNRKKQAEFICVSCGFEQNADIVSGVNSLLWALGLGREHVPEGYSSKPLLNAV
jgi:putative transposase